MKRVMLAIAFAWIALPVDVWAQKAKMTPSHVASCRAGEHELRQRIQATYREMDQCHKSHRPTVGEGQDCSYADGPRVVQVKTAWPQCSSILVNRCELEAERREMAATCQRLNQELIEQNREHENELREAGRYQEEQRGVFAKNIVRHQFWTNLQNDPKTLLIGTLSNRDMRAHASFPSQGDTYKNQLEFIASQAPWTNSSSSWPSLSTLRSKLESAIVQSFGAGPQGKLVSVVRSIFPSFALNGKELSTTDSQKIYEMIVSGSSQALMSQHPGIRAIQKSMLGAILEMQKGYIASAQIAMHGITALSQPDERTIRDMGFARKVYRGELPPPPPPVVYHSPPMASSGSDDDDDSAAQALNAFGTFLGAVGGAMQQRGGGGGGRPGAGACYGGSGPPCRGSNCKIVPAC